MTRKLIKHKDVLHTTDATASLKSLEKAQIVLLYDKFLNETLAHLSQLKDLKQYLEFPPINELD